MYGGVITIISLKHSFIKICWMTRQSGRTTSSHKDKIQNSKLNNKQVLLCPSKYIKIRDQTRPIYQFQRKTIQVKEYCKSQLSTFLDNYAKFCQENQNMSSKLSLKNYVWAKKNIQIINALFTQVLMRGGIIKVLSQGLFSQVCQMVQKNNNKQKNKNVQAQLFKIYQIYLVKYEFSCNGSVYKNIKFQQFKLQMAKFINKRQLELMLDQKQQKNSNFVFDCDVIVFRQGQDVLQLKYRLFNLKKFMKQFKHLQIDIRIQQPFQLGFNIKKNMSSKIKIKDFYYYQKICKKLDSSDLRQFIKQNDSEDLLKQLKKLKLEGTDLIKRLKDGQIFFGVNIDLAQQSPILMFLKSRIQNTSFCYKNKTDLLSYLGSNILGCSVPQFYVKVHNVWTGGHQENLNMVAININFGPASSQWLTLEQKYVQNLRQFVKTKYSIDILQCEGNWFQQISWFIKHNFPIKRFIQKQKDIVALGPGTLHWVRSQGVNLQCAWNLFPTTTRQLQSALMRQSVNSEMKFKYSNIVPLKSLAIKLLNHQASLLPQKVRNLLTSNLQKWYTQQSQTLWKIRSRINIKFQTLEMLYQTLEQASSFCQSCHQQILIFFGDGLINTQIRCLSCLQLQKVYAFQIYAKYNQTDLTKLIKDCKENNHNQQIQRLCNDQNYIGRDVRCKLKQKLQIQKDQQIKQLSIPIFGENNTYLSSQISNNKMVETKHTTKQQIKQIQNKYYNLNQQIKRIKKAQPKQQAQSILLIQQSQQNDNKNYFANSKTHFQSKTFKNQQIKHSQNSSMQQQQFFKNKNHNRNHKIVNNNIQSTKRQQNQNQNLRTKKTQRLSFQADQADFYQNTHLKINGLLNSLQKMQSKYLKTKKMCQQIFIGKRCWTQQNKPNHKKQNLLAQTKNLQKSNKQKLQQISKRFITENNAKNIYRSVIDLDQSAEENNEILEHDNIFQKHDEIQESSIQEQQQVLDRTKNFQNKPNSTNLQEITSRAKKQKKTI